MNSLYSRTIEEVVWSNWQDSWLRNGIV